MKCILMLRVLPDTSDPNRIRRLRMGIKTLLRAYRLLSEYIRQVKRDGPDGEVAEQMLPEQEEK